MSLSKSGAIIDARLLSAEAARASLVEPNSSRSLAIFSKCTALVEIFQQTLYLWWSDIFGARSVLYMDMDVIEPVELLRRQYIQLIDPERLTLPSQELLRLPDTQAQIFHSLFDESALSFSPPERYNFRVLKRLISALEEAVVDPDEDVCLCWFSKKIDILILAASCVLG